MIPRRVEAWEDPNTAFLRMKGLPATVLLVMEVRPTGLLPIFPVKVPR